MTEKKREILGAASRVFRRKGFHAAGMLDIAAELEMAVGNLYYDFRDKEDFLAFTQQTTLAARVIRADETLWLLVAGHITLLNEVIPGSFPPLEVEALGKELGSTGTKHGCGLGECGTCAALVGGRFFPE